MDAVKFLKEKKRMCDMYESCQAGCPLYKERTQKFTMCNQYCYMNPEEAVRIVAEWSAEHPVKTRQSEFLDIFPNAEVKDGYLHICPGKIDKDFECNNRICSSCLQKYWLGEAGEQNERDM